MATLGALNIVLSATTEAFTRGMEKAHHDLGHLAHGAEEMNEKVRGHFEGIGGHAERLGGLLSGAGIESALTGMTEQLSGLAGSAAGVLDGMGPAGMAIGTVAIAATAAAGAVVGLAMAVKSIVEPQMEIIDHAYKTAAALGLSTDALMTFHAIAKREADAAADVVDAAMTRMLVSVGKAAAGDEKSGAAFEKLKLDVQELSAMDTGAQFREIVEALDQVGAHSDKIRDAREIFGKGITGILPALHEIAEGYDEIHGKLLENKTVLDNVDASNVVAAKDAWEDFSERLEGLKNQLTVSLLPEIMAIGQAFMKVLPSAKQFGAVAVEVAEDVIYSIAFLMDWLDGVPTAFGKIISIATPAIGLISSLVEVMQKFGGFHDIAPSGSNRQKVLDMFQDLKKQIEQAGKEMNDQMAANGAQAGDAMSEAMEEHLQSLNEKLEELGAKAEEKLNFQRWLAFDGDALAKTGMSAEALKQVFDAIQLDPMGENAKAIEALKEHLKAAAKYEEFNKAGEAVRKLHQEIDALQKGISGEAAKFSDPALQEQIAGEEKKRDALKEQIKFAQDLAKAQQELQMLRQGMDPKNAAAAAAGVDQAHLDEAQRIQDEINLWKEKARVIEESKTPLEHYQDQINKLDDMLMAGVLDSEQYGKAVAKVQNDFSKSQHKDNGEQHAGAESISQKYVVSAQTPVANDALSVAKQQLDIQTKSYNVSSDLARKLGVPPQVVSF